MTNTIIQFNQNELHEIYICLQDKAEYMHKELRDGEHSDIESFMKDRLFNIRTALAKVKANMEYTQETIGMIDKIEDND